VKRVYRENIETVQRHKWDSGEIIWRTNRWNSEYIKCL